MQLTPYQTPSAENNASPIGARTPARAPTIALVASASIVIVGTLMVCAKAGGFVGGLLIVPFIFGPLMLAWIPMWMCRNGWSQGVLLIANIAYAIWFLYVYLDVFHFHPGTYRAIALLYVGFYSVPALIIACAVAIVMNRGPKLS